MSYGKLYEFRKMYGQDFIRSRENLDNISVLFFYFLKDKKFFECKNLKSGLSRPSFTKGLMIIGGYGVGKTAYFKIFEKLFYKHAMHKFKGFGAKELVSKYEACVIPSDKPYMLNNIVKPNLFIDDVGSEKIASNYGNCDVIEEILFNQNEKKHKTYICCNYTNTENNIEQTLIDLAERYGGRMHDRFYKMFNIICFTGKSLRR